MKTKLITLAVLLTIDNQVQASDDWEIKLNVSPISGTAPMSVSIQTTIVEAPASTGKDTTTEIVKVTSAGQVWMDRNLGASRVATSSSDELAYGDLYQWGRGADGHEKRTSPITLIASSVEDPGHGEFIIMVNDWLDHRNGNLWQGTNGTNNPCPTGFRLPTGSELERERASWISNDSSGAFGSPLKLVVSADRKNEDGTLDYENTGGFYWSSTADPYDDGGVRSLAMKFLEDYAVTSNSDRANGLSVRCIQD